jgi:hypothetical protein
MPPVAVIRRLVVAGKQAWLDGFTSVKYAHINGDTLTHFPLWVITFWNTVVDMRLQIRKPWREAMDWVKHQMQQKKRSDVRKMAAETSCLLALLHWNTAKRGLSDTSPVHTLWRYLGPTWLSSTDENDMLEVLREKIVGDPDLVRTVRVEAVELSAKLSETFEKRDSVDYDQSLSTRWLRSLGEDIFCRGERLVTIAHLGAHNKQKHWVAIEVDGAKLQFRYGDSLGKAIPRNMQMVYEWWASKHVPGQLEFSSLPISSQTDGHSCGMLAVNAIEHALYPTSSPLMVQADVVLGRLAVFDQLVSRILDRVRGYNLCLCLAEETSRLRTSRKRKKTRCQQVILLRRSQFSHRHDLSPRSLARQRSHSNSGNLPIRAPSTSLNRTIQPR